MQIVKKEVSRQAPKLLSTIAQSLGGPYASLIGSFVNILGGEGGQQGGQGGYYEGAGYQEPYDQQYQPGSQDMYAQEGQYAPQEGYYEQGGAPQEGYYEQGGAPQGGYYEQGGASQEPYYEQRTAQVDAGYQQSQVYQQPLNVNIDLVKEVYENGRYTAKPIADGDTLTGDDNYKVLFQCNMQCFMYVAQLDTTGKMDPIFPSQYVPWNNPLRSGVLYSAPPDRNWFYLDRNTGVETIYFIVSRTRRTDIEGIFRQLSEKNKTLFHKVPVSIQEPLIVMRGIGGTRVGSQQSVQFNDGSQGNYASTLFNSIKADFSLTRWFHHR
jgi:hypothetical protein